MLFGTCQKVILSRSECSFFAKIGRVASEEVTVQLIKVKCLPVLLYGLEACPLTKSDLQSLDFVINRFFMKIFTTKNIEIVKYCQEYFSFALPSVLWAKRVSKFESSFKCFRLLCNCVVLIVFVLFMVLSCLFGEQNIFKNQSTDFHTYYCAKSCHRTTSSGYQRAA